MIFKDLPEFVNEETVYQTLSFFTPFEDMQECIEKSFEYCSSAELIDELNILRFWNGDILMFSYRDDGARVITAYNARERFVIVIYDKDIYDYLLKQGAEDEAEDYIVPKLDKAKFEPARDDIREAYLSSMMHEYCCHLVDD